MLLDYNDIDEANIQAKAIALRQRVAGRKLQELTEAGCLDADIIAHLKESSRDARKAHAVESFDIIVANTHDRIACERADQHLAAERQVRTLGKDVTRAARLGKAKLDSLNDLEKRIMGMRAKLQNSMSLSAETAIATEVRSNIKAVKLDKQFKNCSHCNRRILVQLLYAHEHMCLSRKDASVNLSADELSKRDVFNPTVNNMQTNMIASLSTFKPQPPRNCRVVNKGASYITWEWDPPVFDGGLVVSEYELSYTAKMSDFDVKTGKYKKWEEHVPSLLTTCWIFRSNPVCNTGFKMTYLRANTEYTMFRIRSYNLRGWSEWVHMLPDFHDKILTDPAQPPSAPLFVNVDFVTSSCVYLSWSPPLFDGGLTIIDYIIYYTCIEKQVTVTSRDEQVQKHRCFYVQDANAVQGVIRNLPESTEVIDIAVCAVNSGQIVGTKGISKQSKCVTKASSRYIKVAQELGITTKATEEFVDSAFCTVSAASVQSILFLIFWF
jgi:hypothetical protein